MFEQLDRRHELHLGAPTGNAAILVRGHTLHSLLMLPDKKCTNFTELRKIWSSVKYLIIDEVSMISAHFLSQILARLKEAKGEDLQACHLSFGGINLIFTGDFGQLLLWIHRINVRTSILIDQ